MMHNGNCVAILDSVTLTRCSELSTLTSLPELMFFVLIFPLIVVTVVRFWSASVSRVP